jgi:putative phosphoesterase
MKIGIISDTHDDLCNLEMALGVLQKEGVSRIIHCGDVCGKEIVRAMSGYEVWIAQGNMDHPYLLNSIVDRELGRGRLARIHRLTLDGHSLAVAHGHDEELVWKLASGGGFAYVFRGHTHSRQDRMVGRTRVINPGALGGRGRQRSLCLLDLRTGQARFLDV